MFTKVRNALFNVVGGVDTFPSLRDAEGVAENTALKPKFPYKRPDFLVCTTEEEIAWSGDHTTRPILVTRDFTKIPWNSGYAECVNAGKSLLNEDQAIVRRAYLQRPESKSSGSQSGLEEWDWSSPYPEHLNAATCLPYVYFAMFDGHAGVGAAVAAANQLHHVLHEKLVDVIDLLLPPIEGTQSIPASSRRRSPLFVPEKEVTTDSLIIGALESSFFDMDELIREDRQKYDMKGGCTALVGLFILGKLFVANAGDSRAVLLKDKAPIPMSNDFTPETERQRIRNLGAQFPVLLGNDFTHLDFTRKPNQNDLGKRILYRDAYMTGWAYKTVTATDLKFPVVYGEGKRSRVLATIGVTRGFGDHDLKSLYSHVPVKPFLLSQPEVMIFDVQNEEITLNDVLIMGTDGLWDVTSNEKAAEIACRSLDHFSEENLRYKYVTAAQELVMNSRGKMVDKSWRAAGGRAATVDDISVYVIPIKPYKEEFLQWKQQYDAVRGIYDSGSDSADPYGKLSLKPSPSPLGSPPPQSVAEKNNRSRSSSSSPPPQSVMEKESGHHTRFREPSHHRINSSSESAERMKTSLGAPFPETKLEVSSSPAEISSQSSLESAVQQYSEESKSKLPPRRCSVETNQYEVISYNLSLQQPYVGEETSSEVSIGSFLSSTDIPAGSSLLQIVDRMCELQVTMKSPLAVESAIQQTITRTRTEPLTQPKMRTKTISQTCAGSLLPQNVERLKNKIHMSIESPTWQAFKRSKFDMPPESPAPQMHLWVSPMLQPLGRMKRRKPMPIEFCLKECENSPEWPLLEPYIGKSNSQTSIRSPPPMIFKKETISQTSVETPLLQTAAESPQLQSFKKMKTGMLVPARSDESQCIAKMKPGSTLCKFTQETEIQNRPSFELPDEESYVEKNCWSWHSFSSQSSYPESIMQMRTKLPLSTSPGKISCQARPRIQTWSVTLAKPIPLDSEEQSVSPKVELFVRDISSTNLGLLLNFPLQAFKPWGLHILSDSGPLFVEVNITSQPSLAITYEASLKTSFSSYSHPFNTKNLLKRKINRPETPLHTMSPQSVLRKKSSSEASLGWIFPLSSKEGDTFQTSVKSSPESIVQTGSELQSSNSSRKVSSQAQSRIQIWSVTVAKPVSSDSEGQSGSSKVKLILRDVSGTNQTMIIHVSKKSFAQWGLHLPSDSKPLFVQVTSATQTLPGLAVKFKVQGEMSLASSSQQSFSFKESPNLKELVCENKLPGVVGLPHVEESSGVQKQLGVPKVDSLNDTDFTPESGLLERHKELMPGIKPLSVKCKAEILGMKEEGCGHEQSDMLKVDDDLRKDLYIPEDRLLNLVLENMDLPDVLVDLAREFNLEVEFECIARSSGVVPKVSEFPKSDIPADVVADALMLHELYGKTLPGKIVLKDIKMPDSCGAAPQMLEIGKFNNILKNVFDVHERSEERKDHAPTVDGELDTCGVHVGVAELNDQSEVVGNKNQPANMVPEDNELPVACAEAQETP